MTPRFKVVTTDKIRPLMEYEEAKVQYLIDSIRTSQSIDFILPMLAAGRSQYLLLQDSAVLEAARRLDISALPAQITAVRNLRRLSGEIYAESFTPDLVKRFIDIFPRDTIELTSKKELGKYTDRIALDLNICNESRIYLTFRQNSSGNPSSALFDFFSFVGKHCRFTRSLYGRPFQTANIKQSRHWSQIKLLNITALDLIHAGTHGLLFPGGMLQFESGARIFGIDFPVDVLNEKVSVREKERFLRDLISYRFSTGHPEFIGSGVYLLHTPAKNT